MIQKALEGEHKYLYGMELVIGPEERNSISGKLHDGLGQDLVCLKMAAHRLSNKLEKTENDDIRNQAYHLLEMIEDILGTVRQIATDIRPNVLHRFGLIAAIEYDVSELNKIQGVTVTLISEMKNSRTNKCIDLDIFRITQQILREMISLDNLSKITIKISEKEERTIISIQQTQSGEERPSIEIPPVFADLENRARIVGGEMSTVKCNRKLYSAISIPLFN